MDVLEQTYFKREFYYNKKLVEHFIYIIQNSEGKRAAVFKNLVFKMMKDIVIKNVNNYLNLLSATSIAQLPERDEVISDCYIIFDKCVDGYKVNNGYNFYFYFNKSLSRNFFRNYIKEQKRGNSHMLIDEEMTYDLNFRVRPVSNTVEILVEHLGFKFNEQERRLIKSKIDKQTMTEFLKENPDMTRTQYLQMVEEIQERIQELKEKDIL